MGKAGMGAGTRLAFFNLGIAFSFKNKACFECAGTKFLRAVFICMVLFILHAPDLIGRAHKSSSLFAHGIWGRMGLAASGEVPKAMDYFCWPPFIAVITGKNLSYQATTFYLEGRLLLLPHHPACAIGILNGSRAHGACQAPTKSSARYGGQGIAVGDGLGGALESPCESSCLAVIGEGGEGLGVEGESLNFPLNVGTDDFTVGAAGAH